MKTCFRNAASVAYLWANQLQIEARSGENFFFLDNTIYSYGMHYPIGKVVRNAKNETAYVLNTDYVSQTTHVHSAIVERAIPNGALIFHVSGAVSPNRINGHCTGFDKVIELVITKLNELDNYLWKQSRARKTTYYSAIENCIWSIKLWIKFWGIDKSSMWGDGTFHNIEKHESIFNVMENLHLHFADGNMDFVKEWACASMLWACLQRKKILSKIFSFEQAKDPVSQSIIDDFVKYWCRKEVKDALSKCTQNLITLIQQQKGNTESKALAECLDDLDDWRNGKIQYWNTFGTGFYEHYGWDTALRVNNGMIELSKSITISFDEGKKLWQEIKACENGEKSNICYAGHANNGRLITLDEYKDHMIYGGCCIIPFSECERIAKQLNW